MIDSGTLTYVLQLFALVGGIFAAFRFSIVKPYLLVIKNFTDKQEASNKELTTSINKLNENLDNIKEQQHGFDLRLAQNEFSNSALHKRVDCIENYVKEIKKEI